MKRLTCIHWWRFRRTVKMPPDVRYRSLRGLRRSRQVLSGRPVTVRNLLSFLKYYHNLSSVQQIYCNAVFLNRCVVRYIDKLYTNWYAEILYKLFVVIISYRFSRLQNWWILDVREKRIFRFLKVIGISVMVPFSKSYVR